MGRREFNKRILLHAVVILILSLIQSTPWYCNLLPAPPLLLLPLTVCYGMFEREKDGAVLGAFAGLLWDTSSVRAFGFNTVMLMAIGCVCGLLITHLMRNTFTTGMLLCFGAVALYQFIDWLFYYVVPGYGDVGYAFLHLWLPQLAGTFLLILPYYFTVRYCMKRLRMLEGGRMKGLR